METCIPVSHHQVGCQGEADAGARRRPVYCGNHRYREVGDQTNNPVNPGLYLFTDTLTTLENLLRLYIGPRAEAPAVATYQNGRQDRLSACS